MIKVRSLIMNAENSFLSYDHLLREIGAKYKKRLKEKPNFWDKSVSQIKMDFTLIPTHDERLAFWLIRKEYSLVVQCYVFKYQYKTDWQLILSKEIDIKSFDDGFNVVEAEKEIMATIEAFLDMECKDSQKDDEIKTERSDDFEVEFFNELPKENDPRLKVGQVWKVCKTREYNFAGYYMWNGEKWEFERDLD